jgi:nucleotidyltransferase substrate binding protein (TIGR01987 family)
MEISAVKLRKRVLSSMKRLDQVEGDFAEALKTLEEAASEAKSDLEIDGAIQRFEFTYELFWKLLRAYLQQEGIVVNTPREWFKEAYGLGILESEEIALRMVDDRNLTVHLYDKETSRDVFDRIRSLYVSFYREVYDRIRRKAQPRNP